MRRLFRVVRFSFRVLGIQRNDAGHTVSQSRTFAVCAIDITCSVGDLADKKGFEEKIKMRASELSKRAGLSVQQVRHYTRIGLLRPARNRRNNYHSYREADAARLVFIKKAKTLGYTLREIAEIFAESERGKSPCPLVREILEHRIADNRRKIDDMLELQKLIESALLTWNKMPDKLPDGDSVCHLIESTGAN